MVLVEQGAPPPQLRKEASATVIEAHVRGNIVRQTLVKQTSAATLIEAHERGHHCRREYVKKRNSAIAIQGAQRGRVMRKRFREEVWGRKEDPQHASALALVNRLLKENEGPKGAPKIAQEFLTLDFADECDLGIPGQKHASKGVKEYLHASMTRTLPKVVGVTVPLWATRTVCEGNYMETTVEREVLLPGDKAARVEYTVRHGQRPQDDRVCRRRMRAVHFSERPTAPEGADGVASSSPEVGLRESFAKLDADGSGHLSIAEICRASSLVGLRFDESELQKTLLVGDNDGDGSFELHELDAILKKDRVLTSIGFEQLDRPLLFDVLPLVARSFDAHTMVESCLRDAAARDRAIENEQRRTRVAATRDLTQSTEMVALRKVAHRDQARARQKNKPKRRSARAESPSVVAAQRAMSQSTAELAQIVENFEERLKDRAERDDGNVGVTELAAYESMSAALDEACSAANRQRAKLAALPASMAAAPQQPKLRHAALPRSKSSAFERPRRPHALPPLGAAPRRDRFSGALMTSVSAPVVKTRYELAVETAEVKRLAALV